MLREIRKTVSDHRLTLIGATAIAPLVWGTTYLVTTEMLPPGRPILAALLRSLPAGVALAAATRQRPVGGWWVKASVLGVLNIGGFFALLFVAAYRLPGGVAAMLGAVQPLVAAVLAAVLIRERLTLLAIFSGVLGMVGVGLLVLTAEARLDTVGILAGLGGALSMALGVVLTKHWGRPVGLLAFTSWQLMAGGAFLLVLVLVLEGLPDGLTAMNVAGFLWLGGVGTALAYALWFRGIELLPVARVSMLGLLSPVVAAVAGWVVLEQTLGGGQLPGMALVLIAVWFGQSERNQLWKKLFGSERSWPWPSLPRPWLVGRLPTEKAR